MTRHFRTFLLFVLLFAAWLLMSGHYTPLLITLGVVSCVGAALLADRIGGTDEEGLPLHVMARLPAYLAWLVKEIIMSNIATGRLILFGRARPATGFSTDLAALAQRVTQSVSFTRIFAPHTDAEGLQEAIQQLRAAGKVVIQALDAEQTPRSMGCDQQLTRSQSGWVTEAVSGS